MKPITIWERLYKTDRGVHSQHNHIEDGHHDSKIPNAKFQIQKKCWQKADGWRSTKGYLDSNQCIIIT